MTERIKELAKQAGLSHMPSNYPDMTDNITLPRAVVEEVRELIRTAVYSPYGSEFRDPYKHQQAALTALAAALAEPEPDAIARAVEAAVKECVTICERQRVKILKNPADPSWTEHLAEVQSAMKQRFSVEMGYPALAEPDAIARAVEAEREACAKVCDLEFAACWHADAISQAKEAKRCADAIRARGSK